MAKESIYKGPVCVSDAVRYFRSQGARTELGLNHQEARECFAVMAPFSASSRGEISSRVITSAGESERIFPSVDHEGG